MRVLHTSDWHLGRSFHGQDLLGAQREVLVHLASVVREREVDFVVVAGDVYDRALPAVDAVAVADEGLHALAATGARVVVSSGNHDSARRLGFGSRLVDAAGVHLRTSLERVGEPVLLRDDHGEVAVYALPYLDPDVARSTWGLATRSHQAAMVHAMRLVREDLAGRSGTRAVVLAHAFVTGGTPSDSERDIAVGGVAAVSLDTFEGIDYVALGHLHTPAVLAPHVRYSGSPLAYSFSEAGHRKGSWLVELGPAGVLDAELVEVPRPRSLAVLRGRLEDLLADPATARHTESWAQVTLTDPARPAQPMDRLRRVLPHVLALRFDPEGVADPDARPPSPSGRAPHEVCLDFVGHVRGSAASEAEADLLRLALESCPDDRDLARELAPVRLD